MHSKLEEFSEPVRRLSTSEMIKEFTREYFLRKRTVPTKENPIPMTDILRDIQVSQKLEDPTAQESIRSFLKVHLKVNEEVVDKEFQPLYWWIWNV